VKPALHQLAQLLGHRETAIACGIAAALLLAGAILWLALRARRPSAGQLELRRRDRLATTGRITDGVLLDARTLTGEPSLSTTPEVLVYSYRIAGVTYNCAQDVSPLADRIASFGLDQTALEQTVQVRYDPHNPGDSILVSEDWTGLWTR
jgi:hypothetical protein